MASLPHQQLPGALSYTAQLCSSVLTSNAEPERRLALLHSSVVVQHVQVIHHADANALLAAYLSATLSDYVLETLQPHFNSSLRNDDVTQGMMWLVDAVSDVDLKLNIIHQLLDKLTSLCPDRGKVIWTQTRTLVESLLVDHGSSLFGEKSKVFYQRSLVAYSALHPCSRSEFAVQRGDGGEEDSEEEDVAVAEEVMEEDDAQCWMQSLSKLSALLLKLQWLSKVVGDVMQDLVKAKIETFAIRYKEVFFGNAFGPMLQFCDRILLPWMEMVACCAAEDGHVPSLGSDVRDKWRVRLKEMVCDTLLQLRIREMFNIIVYYPESCPVIDEMRTCLEMVDHKLQLIQSLRQSLIDRLLQPGADTRDIIAQYASLVKALRQLDPTGVVMEQVCQPVRLYLRCREDCGRCIVETLLMEETGELADEFDRGVKIKSFEEEDFETMLAGWKKWEPEPVDVCLENTSASRTKTDVIGLLITIYGSREQFLSQYQSLLAARLLRTLTYDNLLELGNLERVKVCFEDADLSRCDVMLADVTSSRRLDKAIHERLAKSFAEDKDTVMPSSGYHCFVLSRAYWDNRLLQDTHLAKLKPPQDVQRVMEEYGGQFSELKNSRRLEWCHNIGFVDIDLAFPSGTLSFTCDPLQASLIVLFQGKHTCLWLSRLSKELCVSEKYLRPALLYWINERVLREQSSPFAVFSANSSRLDTSSTTAPSNGANAVAGATSEKDTLYSIIADTTEMSASDPAGSMMMADGIDADSPNGDAGVDERVEMFWSYIEGMLTNFGELPLDRIHSMISLYAEDEVSESQLKTVLDVKLRQRAVIYSAGMYSLPD